jgi:membrane-associated protein
MEGLQSALADHGVWVLFVLAVLEGPLVVLGATALAQLGTLEVRWVWGIAVMADLVGDILLYGAGRFAPGLLPQRHRPHMAQAHIAQERAAALFRQSGGRVLLLAKLTHFAGLPTLVMAGFARMPVLPFLWWSLVGTVLKVSVIVLTGWYFWQALAGGNSRDALAVLLALSLGFGVMFVLLRGRKWT